MGRIKDELELLEAVFKMDRNGNLVPVDKPKSKESKPKAGDDEEEDVPKKPKGFWGSTIGSFASKSGKPSKPPKGFSGVGPDGEAGDEGKSKYKYKPPEKWISAGGVVVGGEDDLDHVYVRKPSNNFGPWSFPKGKIDPGETQEKAALREVREEIGVVAKMAPNGYLGTGEGSMSVTHYYLMYGVRDTGKHDKETEKVKLATFTEAMHLFAKGGNTRDIKILSKAMALIEQIKRAKQK